MFLARCLAAFLLTAPSATAATAPGFVQVRVTHDGSPLPDARVVAGGRSATTGAEGEVVLELPPGPARIEVGFGSLRTETADVVVRPGETIEVLVELHEPVEIEEEIIVTATRSGRRVQDEPVRIEVIAREEIEEKLLMTPGDVAMLLNETSGLRVQVAAPSLGAANVRIQGLRGRYTQILADGLPLYGGQTGSIGLLQIPPMDLGQVEVIKGAASAFYGASALGGVVNLVSRRPPDETAERELLVNRTTREGTDGVLWLAGRTSERTGLTLLAGAHDQRRHDVDHDGWADLAGFTRGLLRPRLFHDDPRGRSIFVTLGAMVERRRGGTLPGATVPDGTAYVESLDTDRFDGGVVARATLGSHRLLAVRMSGMTQRHAHGFGPVRERDRHHTWLAEASLTASRGAHTWVAGAAVQADTYRARDVAGFDFRHVVPGLFVQDEWKVGDALSVSASARLDRHHAFGTFLSPRASVLWKPGRWTVRASAGSGFFAPTPFTEETEAVGLSRVAPLGTLAAERAHGASLDAGRAVGPLELHATAFASVVRDPVLAATDPAGRLRLVNAAGATRTAGAELLGRLRWRDFVATATAALTESTEVDPDTGSRRDVPLTPRIAAGVVAAWEKHGRSRVGLEVYYTGEQPLEDNPYRAESRPYVVIGLLAERRFGRVRAFVNLENLGDARQTRHDPLVRPRRGPDGRWTVDAWAPLEGRTINGGIRLAF